LWLRSDLATDDPILRLIKSSGPLVFLVGGALRWLRRENEHALGHFLERSTQIDVALQQSALIPRKALTAPARQWRSAANLEQYNGRDDSMTG